MAMWSGRKRAATNSATVISAACASEDGSLDASEPGRWNSTVLGPSRSEAPSTPCGSGRFQYSLMFMTDAFAPGMENPSGTHHPTQTKPGPDPVRIRSEEVRPGHDK